MTQALVLTSQMTILIRARFKPVQARFFAKLANSSFRAAWAWTLPFRLRPAFWWSVSVKPIIKKKLFSELHLRRRQLVKTTIFHQKSEKRCLARTWAKNKRTFLFIFLNSFHKKVPENEEMWTERERERESGLESTKTLPRVIKTMGLLGSVGRGI